MSDQGQLVIAAPHGLSHLERQALTLLGRLEFLKLPLSLPQVRVNLRAIVIGGRADCIQCVERAAISLFRQQLVAFKRVINSLLDPSAHRIAVGGISLDNPDRLLIQLQRLRQIRIDRSVGQLR